MVLALRHVSKPWVLKAWYSNEMRKSAITGATVMTLYHFTYQLLSAKCHIPVSPNMAIVECVSDWPGVAIRISKGVTKSTPSYQEWFGGSSTTVLERFPSQCLAIGHYPVKCLQLVRKEMDNRVWDWEWQRDKDHFKQTPCPSYWDWLWQTIPSANARWEYIQRYQSSFVELPQHTAFGREGSQGTSIFFDLLHILGLELKFAV